MTAFYAQEADNITPPGSGGTIAVPSAASSTVGSGNLTAYQGRWLWIKSSAKTHVRFGTSSVGAATTGDIYLTADVDYPMRVPRDGTRSYVRARGAAAGTLHYRVTSGPV